MAARTGEVPGRLFEEIDTVTSMWAVPGKRMTGDKNKSLDDHVVRFSTWESPAPT